MPVYNGVKGNERADLAAKKAVKDRVSLYGSSLIYMKKGILTAVESKKKKWLKKTLRKKQEKSEIPYLLNKNLFVTLVKTRKYLTIRFLLLKSSHAIIATFYVKSESVKILSTSSMAISPKRRSTFLCRVTTIEN